MTNRSANKLVLQVGVTLIVVLTVAGVVYVGNLVSQLSTAAAKGNEPHIGDDWDHDKFADYLKGKGLRVWVDTYPFERKNPGYDVAFFNDVEGPKGVGVMAVKCPSLTLAGAYRKELDSAFVWGRWVISPNAQSRSVDLANEIRVRLK